MRENDGRRLDHQTLETLRLRAVDQVRAGVHPVEVARAIGMNRSTVYAWVAKESRSGRESLKAKPVPGRKPKLDQAQTRRVYEVVVGSNPDQAGFDFGLWTRDLVREVIRREFRIRLSVSAVGRLLRRIGLSPQRPLYRAYQADPEKAEAWRAEEYPGIVAQAKKTGAVIFFADEASVRSDHHAGTTWGAVGRTPVIREATGARFSVNMVSAVSPRGELRFQIVQGTMTAPKFITFCQRLVAGTARPVILIVDGHPVHRSKAVREYAESTNGRLTLKFLPSYSPQLNPDEWVCKNDKNDRVGRRIITGPDQFKALCVSALRRLQKLPALVRGFFHDPNLAYITRAEQTATT
ncbi:MAG: IS630 family transposase [Propionibacteriaceae bacterium]|jgi:transposase|nr:IS630 family transposase [Propionibacteriaceae bacterium]